MRQIKFSFAAFCLIMIVLSGLAAFALLRATPNGMGLTNDSAAYIGGARGILQGQGYSDIWLDSSLEPITHYPPLFSLTLAGLGLLGLDPLRGARVVNVLAFGASTFLVGLLGLKMCRSRLAGAALAALFATNTALFRVYADALSEPLFLFLTLGSFSLFSLHFERKKAGWLAAAGAVVGLAYLTRYTGLALAATFCAALFLLKDTWRERLISAGIFLAGFLPLAAAWAVRNRVLAGNATNRVIGWHPVTLDNTRRGVWAFSTFLMPLEEWQKALYKAGAVTWFLAAAGLALLVWLLIRVRHFVRPKNWPQPENISFATGLYIFGYLSAVVASMTLFDASTKFQPRILSPVYLSILILLAAFGTWLWRQGKPFQILVIVLAAFSLGVSLVGFQRAFLDLEKAGQGYASWKWRDSPIMATIEDLPAGKMIYTNSPPAVYLVTGRASRVLPTPVDAVTLQARDAYDADIVQMRADVLDGRAVLAIFDITEVESPEDNSGFQPLLAGLPLAQKQGNDLLFGSIAEE